MTFMHNPVLSKKIITYIIWADINKPPWGLVTHGYRVLSPPRKQDLLRKCTQQLEENAPHKLKKMYSKS